MACNFFGRNSRDETNSDRETPQKFPRNLNLTISHVTLPFLFVIHPGNTTQEKQKQGYFA